jgi:HSP20 family protein
VSDHSRDPIERFQREVERLFHDLVYRRHPSSHFGQAPWQPPVDVMATEQRACVRVELPGVSSKDFGLSLNANVLRVRGVRRAPRDLPDADYHRAEIFYGPFERLVELPWRADPDHIEARYKDGLLEIQLVPLPEAAPSDISIDRESLE